MQTQKGSLNITQRVLLPTPPFFKKLRTIGLVLAAVSGTVASAPFELPAVIVQAAGYVAVAAGVLSAVSQTAVDDRQLIKPEPDE